MGDTLPDCCCGREYRQVSIGQWDERRNLVTIIIHLSLSLFLILSFLLILFFFPILFLFLVLFLTFSFSFFLSSLLSHFTHTCIHIHSLSLFQTHTKLSQCCTLHSFVTFIPSILTGTDIQFNIFILYHRHSIMLLKKMLRKSLQND